VAKTFGLIWRVALFAITVTYIIACLRWGYRAHFVYSVNAQGIPVEDGLGRPLFPAPWFFRFFLGAGARWAGAKSFWLENLVFWTSSIILTLLNAITNAFSEGAS
jgi:hypothetical protein